MGALRRGSSEPKASGEGPEEQSALRALAAPQRGEPRFRRKAKPGRTVAPVPNEGRGADGVGLVDGTNSRQNPKDFGLQIAPKCRDLDRQKVLAIFWPRYVPFLWGPKIACDFGDNFPKKGNIVRPKIADFWPPNYRQNAG